MSQDPIREAFQKAKQDVIDLKALIISLQNEISQLKSSINELQSHQNQESNTPTHQQTNQQTHNSSIPTHNYPIPTQNPSNSSSNPTLQHINQTNNPQNPAYNQENTTEILNELPIMPQYSLKTPNIEVSSGNRGVPTDRQTNQQTNQQTHNSSYFSQKIPSEVPKLSPSDRLIQVSEALSSLDSIKRELYHQIKRLTNQEMLIFSTIYQLQEEGFTVDYSILASKLSLSESSIREYTLKLIAKGIPIAKSKVNNKKIILSIPENLKKLASLTTILALREI
ncbi:MAG: hypothetical protein AABX11_03385 [Nanoarchaeota archaeon]